MTGGHLGKDAAYGPYIHSSWITIGAEQKFRSTVPKSNNLVGVGAIGEARKAGQAKVSKFNLSSICAD